MMQVREKRILALALASLTQNLPMANLCMTIFFRDQPITQEELGELAARVGRLTDSQEV